MWDMLDSAKAVLSFVSGISYDEHSHDRKAQMAVERALEIRNRPASFLEGVNAKELLKNNLFPCYVAHGPGMRVLVEKFLGLLFQLVPEIRMSDGDQSISPLAHGFMP